MEAYVYIHGVVEDIDRRHGHEHDYRSLHEGISAQRTARGEPSLPAFDHAIGVEWGFDVPAAQDTRQLAMAQRTVAARVDHATPADTTSLSSALLAPAIRPVRNLIQAAWADIVYYVSEKGKARVRALVWNTILERLGADVRLDLTIVGHSAGSLIAHDFLFWLFSGERDEAAMASPGLDAGSLDRARSNWRLRRLVTLGSPLTALAVRSVAVTDLLARGRPLDATLLGLGRPDHSGREPIWLNVWDRHDVLSYPVEPIYERGKIIDLYPEHSDSMVAAHNAYWRSSRVHQALAQLW